MGLAAAGGKVGRAEEGPAATVGAPRRRSVWGCISASLSLCVSLCGAGRAMCLLLCVTPSLQLTVSLPLYRSSPPWLHCLSLTISLISFCLSVFLLVSVCLSVSPLSPSLCLSVSLFLSVPVLCMPHCLSLSIFLSALVTPQSPQRDPELPGPLSPTRQTSVRLPQAGLTMEGLLCTYLPWAGTRALQGL